MTMEKTMIGWDTVFYYGVKQTDLGKISRPLKHVHGNIIMGPFEDASVKVIVVEYTEHEYCFFLHNKLLLILFVMGIFFITFM